MSTFLKAQMQLPFYEKTDRKRRHILSEFVQVKRLMPLLMKPHNKQQWTPQDKCELILDLKCLSRMSVYIAVLVMPGGFAQMQVMAWGVGPLPRPALCPPGPIARHPRCPDASTQQSN